MSNFETGEVTDKGAPRAASPLTGTTQMNAENQGGNSLDKLIVLAKRKKLIIFVPLLFGVLAAAGSFLIPDSFKATTKILPPQQAQSGAAAILSQLGGVAGAAAGAAGIKNPNDLYIGMLKSRTIADNLIQRFNLKEDYDEKTMEKTRLELEQNTTITSGKDGLLTIEVADHGREKVAQIANAYADELLKLTKVIAVTEAGQRRLFFERQLTLTKENLAHAEAELKSSFGTHGVISVDSESRSIVETVARLRATIAAKEIQLGAMRAFVTESNQDYRRLREEISSARAELARLENGAPSLQVKDGQYANGLENIKVLREVKYQQMLYELLSKQYEVARLDEAKDSSIIQVLDKAIVPERKFKPKRAILVLLFMFMGFLSAIAWAFIADSLARRTASASGREKLNELKMHLRF